MSKEDRLMSRVENCDLKRMKEQIKLVNGLEVADKIKLVGIKKLEMANLFTVAVEAIAEKLGEEAIPDSVSDLYNDFHTDEESPLDGNKKDKPKKDKPKKDKPKKDKPKKASGPPKEPADEYGTRPNTLARFFIEAIKKVPQTMEDVRKADWNPRGYHFKETLERLVEDGKASVDKDGIITIK